MIQIGMILHHSISNHKKMCNKNLSYGMFYPIKQCTVLYKINPYHIACTVYELIYDRIQYHIIILNRMIYIKNNYFILGIIR